MSMQTINEKWKSLPANTKKITVAMLAGTLLLATIGAFAFNLQESDYSTLFTGLNQEEAREVVSYLQDENVEYKYNAATGSIQIPGEQVDQKRADLLSRGYPKSGFAYDMYLSNAGLMSTEADKKQFTLYDLQDRLGAQIRLFDGVSDAKVTIAEAKENRYALEDDASMEASAAVVVTMKPGAVLTADKAVAVKRLLETAVRGMSFKEVSVFDAATMLEVDGGSSLANTAYGAAQNMTDLTSMVENNIATNVRRVLEPLYGVGNVAVSVKGTLNMERLISESTQYTTPEKTAEDDKMGLLQQEMVSSQNMGGTQEAGGVAGTDANADTPRYQYGAQGGDSGGYGSSDASREWLYNSVKEQRQIDPGVLQDTTAGVVILTDSPDTVPIDDLINLVANSAGIPIDVADQKITIVRAPGPQKEEPVQSGGEDQEAAAQAAAAALPLPLPVIIAVCAGVVLLLLLLLILMLKRRSAKRRKDMELEQLIPALPESGDGFNGMEAAAAGVGGAAGAAGGAGAAGVSAMPGELGADEADSIAADEEIMNLRMQRNLKLKQNIGEFVDQNPQVAAKLIQEWLSGEDENGKRKDRKQQS